MFCGLESKLSPTFHQHEEMSEFSSLHGLIISFNGVKVNIINKALVNDI